MADQTGPVRYEANTLRLMRGVTIAAGMLLSACNPAEHIDFGGVKHKKLQLLQLSANLTQLRVDTLGMLTQDEEMYVHSDVRFNFVSAQLEKHSVGQVHNLLMPQWQKISELKDDLNRRRKYYIAVYQGCVELSKKLNEMTIDIDELANHLVTAHADQRLVYQVTRMLFIVERMKYSLALIKYGQDEEPATILDRLGRDTIVLATQIKQVRWFISQTKLPEQLTNTLLARVTVLRSMNEKIHIAIGGTLERAVEFIGYMDTINEIQKLLLEIDGAIQNELQALDPSPQTH